MLAAYRNLRGGRGRRTGKGGTNEFTRSMAGMPNADRAASWKVVRGFSHDEWIVRAGVVGVRLGGCRRHLSVMVKGDYSLRVQDGVVC